MDEKTYKLLDWATNDDTGVSSIAIFRYMLNMNPSSDYRVFIPPSDASDRGRCIRLLNFIPEWWSRIDEMKRFNEEWAKQVELIKKEGNFKSL